MKRAAIDRALRAVGVQTPKGLAAARRAFRRVWRSWSVDRRAQPGAHEAAAKRAVDLVADEHIRRQERIQKQKEAKAHGLEQSEERSDA